jgi:multimeric flavodoxin WrbA
MPDSTVIISGSSRLNGSASVIANYLKDNYVYQIGHFDYEHKNRSDDFLPLIRNVVQDYNVLIMVTPVYWYTMSGIMKVFFDRFSDLLRIEKDLGRKLRGKSMAVISCGADERVISGFFEPFRSTAKYLGMNFISQSYFSLNDQDNLSTKQMKEPDDLMNIIISG